MSRLFMLSAFLLCVSALADNPVQLRVSIKSQPEGATVIVDGRDRVYPTRTGSLLSYHACHQR